MRMRTAWNLSLIHILQLLTLLSGGERALTAIAIQNRSGYHRHRKSPPAVPIFSVQPGEIKHVFFSRARGASWYANA